MKQRSFFIFKILLGSSLASRFGLIRVDYPTQRRIPKLSAQWYREVIARNAVIE